MFLKKTLPFISGLICGLAFAPVFFIFGLLTLSFLCKKVLQSKTKLEAAILGYLFGFGFFLSSIYWISFAPAVFSEELTWMIPVALFGIPVILSNFTALSLVIAWHFRKNKYYHLIFCISWVFCEWLSTWLFGGFPWSLLGYSFCISDTLMQSSSIFGVLGLSFMAIYIGSSLYDPKLLGTRFITSAVILILMIMFGQYRLNTNPTDLSDIKIRVVQPSISQNTKWNPSVFWRNFNKHIKLSTLPGNPDIIIWSEAALTVPYYHSEIYNKLINTLSRNDQVLIFGGIGDNKMQEDDFKIYSSLIAINGGNDILFEYHKSHLVPFGEYMPFKNYLNLKKITAGTIDYSPGKREIKKLNKYNIEIHPLICYESIFSEEVRISNLLVDVILNITNDSWYGNSSGPYQHFYISKTRAIENGLPMIRSANNGISAIIDPAGRVLKKLDLNKVDVLDGYLPKKLTYRTIYSLLGIFSVLIPIFIVLILQLPIKLFAIKLENTFVQPKKN